MVYPADGLSLHGPRQGRGHLRRDQSDHPGHPWFLRKSVHADNVRPTVLLGPNPLNFYLLLCSLLL